jgi:hypothetical protein
MHADSLGLLGCHGPVSSELPGAKLRLNCDKGLQRRVKPRYVCVGCV